MLVSVIAPRVRSRLVATVFAFSLSWLLVQGPSLLHADGASDLQVGRGYYREGFFDRAIEPLERALAATNGAQREEALFLVAESYRATNQWLAAAERYGELLRSFPESTHRSRCAVGRGECLVRLGRAAEALEVLAEATRGDPHEEPHAYYWLAEAQTRTNQVALAIDSYRTLLTRHAQHELAPLARYNLALALRTNGRGAEAIAELDGIAEYPESVRDGVHRLRGDLALEASDPQRALVEFARVGPGPQRAAAWLGTCWAAKALDQRPTFDTAHAALREAEPRDSNLRVEADVLLGAWEAERGQVAETDAALAPHREGPRRDEADFYCAWARARAGLHDEASRGFAELARRPGPWGQRAAARLEGELRAAGQWREALAAALTQAAASADPDERARALAGAVESAYRLGEDNRVIELEHRFLRDHAHDSQRDAVVRFAAEAALRSSRPEAAIPRLQALIARTSDRATIPGLKVRLAWALHDQAADDATAAITALLADERGAPAAEISWLAGRSAAARGDDIGARLAFERAALLDPAGAYGLQAALAAALAPAPSGEAETTTNEEAFRGIIARAPPGSVRARAQWELAERLLRRESYEEAAALYRAVLDDDAGPPNRAAAIIGLCFCEWRQGRIDAAWECLQPLIPRAQDPGDSLPSELRGEVFHLEGRLRGERGDSTGAAAAFERSLVQLAPNSARAHEVLIELGRNYAKAGDVAKASVHLETFVERFPESPDAVETLYRLAWLRSDAGATELARATFERLVERYPRAPLAVDAHYRLADFAYDARDFAEARAHYALVTAAPSASRELTEAALYRTGWSHLHEEAWSAAQAAFEQLATRYPASELAGESLYLAASAAGRGSAPTQEREFLDRLLRAHAQHEHAHAARVRLGELLGDAGDWLLAHDTLAPLRGVELEAALRGRHRLALGRALRHLGAAESAIAVLEEAQSDGGPRAAEAKFEIGLALRDLGRANEAVDAFLSGAFLYPIQPWVARSYVEAARGLIAQGKPAKARRLLERVTEDESGAESKSEARRLLDSLRSGEDF
ncbi:MAG: tetratricopeptide repeat protein [Planctomycetota bacterium]